MHNTTRSIALAMVVALAACGDDVGPEIEDLCMTQPLPLVGSADGPVVVDVGLELQPGEGVIVVATATDPQGSENLRDVLQKVGVFPNAVCTQSPIEISDDLVGSGIEETFGTVVSSATQAGIYAAIEASTSWPVELTFVDIDGNRTEGQVRARIIR